MHLLQGMELDIDNFDIQTVKLAGIKSLLIFFWAQETARNHHDILGSSQTGSHSLPSMKSMDKKGATSSSVSCFDHGALF